VYLSLQVEQHIARFSMCVITRKSANWMSRKSGKSANEKIRENIPRQSAWRNSGAQLKNLLLQVEQHIV
jgi:hypothetical protein